MQLALTGVSAEDHLYEEIQEDSKENEDSMLSTKYHHINGKFSKSVKLSELENYVKVCLESSEFEKQYQTFQTDQTKAWDYGMKQENRSKNRYRNVAAYDHTRVRLDVINNDPCSDYINANYIDGYDTSRAYIATQGPKSNTINDFWRMVWKENVQHIVMIANIVEGGKRKVEKYWPDINETQTYGDITVTYAEVIVFAEYETRVLRVAYGGDEREVVHLHFTCWPDHGTPFYPQSLVPFLKRTLTIPNSTVPIIVHCSAGVGRTGTFILCDICLRMAAKTGEVDVYHHLYRLREQRINMVDNINQYKLVHLVLLHLLVAPDYTVQCTEEMDKIIFKLLAFKNISEQMQYIDRTFWQDNAMRTMCTPVEAPIVPSKNRFEHILPDCYVRVILNPYPPSDQTSAYINAVKVDGFCVPFKFIVTQYPLNNTIGDFWRLIDQYNISVMICLNELDLKNKTCCKFYPTVNEATQIAAYLQLKCVDITNEGSYKIYSIAMSNSNTGENRKIKIICFNKWKYDLLHPESPTELLLAYEELYYLGRTSHTILVTCLDGCRASGLFTAICCLIDKIKMEHVCDVCLAVRTVRHGRMEFVRELQQFSFLYKCGLEYVQQFEMYSNFSSRKQLDSKQ